MELAQLHTYGICYTPSFLSTARQLDLSQENIENKNTEKPAEPVEPDDQILDPLPSENEDDDGSASDSNSGSESDEVDEDRAAEIDDILREHLLNNRKK